MPFGKPDVLKDDPPSSLEQLIIYNFKKAAGSHIHSLPYRVNPALNENHPIFKSRSRAKTLNIKKRYSRKKVVAMFCKDLLKDYKGAYVFTDGSANPNPGPSGCGAYIVGFPKQGDETFLKYSCGYGSNNSAEIQGIALACKFLASHPFEASMTNQLLFFTDSLYAKRSMEGTQRIRKHLAHFRAAKRLFKHTISLFPVDAFVLHWSPGHMGIRGNEIADLLAEQARLENADHPSIVDNFQNFFSDIPNF